MKIYLSGYWKKNCIFGIGTILLIIPATIAFCIWSHDDEDYILIACSMVFIFIFGYLLFISIKLVRYVIKKDNQIIMCSFGGKKLCAINLDTSIYYEVLSLIEGTYSRKNFIVISKDPFDSYQKMNLTGLAKICKAVDASKKQIIMLYEERTIPWLNLEKWHKVN